jgi:hypothetical protein
MGLFNRKKQEDFEEDEIDESDNPRRVRRQFKDLNPENKRLRKEPIKPWGAKERLTVLAVLLITVLTSGILALTARNFKLPKLPQFKLPNISEINPFKEQVIIVGNKGSKISQEKIENSKKLFKEATNDYSGIYAFYIYDLNGDYYYGYNHKEIMQAASLIKLPVMYLAMKNDKDKSMVEAMGKRSDNNAFNKMVGILGKENVNKAISDLGMSNTSLSKNLTTPEEIGLFFKKLYRNELLDEENTKELESYMTNTSFENWLRLGIPEDIKLIHKYGRESRSVSDAGVVVMDKPFVIVIMTDGVIEKEADDLFPKLTKLLYNNHINNENSN